MRTCGTPDHQFAYYYQMILSNDVQISNCQFDYFMPIYAI